MEEVGGSKGPSTSSPMMAGAHQRLPQYTNGASSSNSISEYLKNRVISHSAPPSLVSPSPTRGNLQNSTTLPLPPLPVSNPTRPQDTDDMSLISNHVDEIHGSFNITPCRDFQQYARWLKRHFLEVMDETAVYFVHEFFLIRSRSDLEMYMGFRPEDFLKKLGYKLYQNKLDLIIELTIIWSVTAHLEHSLAYSDYLTYREKYIEFHRNQYSMPLQTPPPYKRDSLAIDSIKNHIFLTQNHILLGLGKLIIVPPLLW